MKNWNYIEGAKTGNTAHSDKVEVIKRLLHANWSVQEIYELLKKEGYEVDKNFIERMKTGNDTPWEYAHRKPKVINDDKTGAEEFFKQLSDDVKEREKKDDADIEKVGNSKWELPDGSTATVEDDGTIKIKKQRDSSIYITKLWDKERAEKQLAQKGAKKVGNFKTGTSQLKPGDKVMSFGKKGTVKEVIGENTDNIYGEPLIKVEFEDGTTKTIGEHYMRKVGNKVGNARYTTREDVISHLDTDLYDICKKVPAGSPSFAYVSELQKKGWDISTISKYTKEIGKIIDQYKVGNSKTGNSAHSDKVEVIKRLLNAKWSVQEIYELLKKEGYEVDKNFIERLKVGNSAQDEKFAYVMREFDAGKLKTPDGKVVTDPAQAKAIAYSESKKTENGLARARKAMNKGITMWKGNDSAYIKEDGTVSYLENNSFETDKDKFESQESAVKELSKQGYVKK